MNRKKFEIPIFTAEELGIMPRREIKIYGDYELSDTIIDKMIEKIDKSIQIKKELGFDLCLHPIDGIKARNDCEGETFCLYTKKDCPHGEKLIGGFHTHPFTDKTDPSSTDIEAAYVAGIECIGARKEIKCYKGIVDIDKFWEKYSLIHKITEDFREVDIKINELLIKRKKLTIQNFERVKVK